MAIENFEAANQGASKQQGFESSNVVVEIQMVCMNQLKENQDEANKERHNMRHELETKFAGAIAE